MLKNKSVIGTIIIGLIVIISTIALLVGFSQAGYVDNDENITDGDLAWRIANWGVDYWFERDPKDLIGKSLGVYVADRDSKATIQEVSAYCLSHLGETGGGNKYKILNIIDVDINMGENIIGKPGLTTIYGGTEGNIWSSTTGDKVTDDSTGKYASEGTEHAIELAYLAANAFRNGETSVTETASKGAYKLALQNSYWRWYNQLKMPEEQRRTWTK